MKPHNIQLTRIIFLVVVLSSLAVNVYAFKVFDGSPKVIFHGNGQSWALKEGVIHGALDRAGIDRSKITVFTHDGGYNSFPISNGVIGGWGLHTSTNWGKYGIENLVMIINIDQFGETGPDDTLKINEGVRQMILVYDHFKSQGVAEVLFANKHYHWGRYRNLRNPVIANTGSAVVLKEYTKRTGRPCADIWSPTEKISPYHTGNDLEHPNELCKEIYGQEYLRMLLANDGLSTYPEEDFSVRNAYNLATEKKKRDAIGLKIVKAPTGNIFKVGASFDLEVTIPPERVNVWSGTVLLYGFIDGYRLGMFVLASNVSLPKVTSTISLKIPDSTRVYSYSIGDAASKRPVQCDSFAIVVMTEGSYGTLNFLPTYRFNSDYTSVVYSPRVESRFIPFIETRENATFNLLGRQMGYSKNWYKQSGITQPVIGAQGITLRKK